MCLLPRPHSHGIGELLYLLNSRPSVQPNTASEPPEGLAVPMGKENISPFRKGETTPELPAGALRN